MQYNTNIYYANTASNYLYLRGVLNGEPLLMKYNPSGNLLWAITAVNGSGEFTRGISVKNNVANVFGNFAGNLNFGFQQLNASNNSYNGDLFIWRYAE